MDRLRTIPTRQSLELRAEASTWLVHRIFCRCMKCWLNTLLLFTLHSGGIHGLRFEEPEMCLAGKNQQNIWIWCPCLNCTVYTLPLRSFHTINCESTWEVCLLIGEVPSPDSNLFLLVSILNARTDKITHQNHEMFLSLYCRAFLVCGLVGKLWIHPIYMQLQGKLCSILCAVFSFSANNSCRLHSEILPTIRCCCFDRLIGVCFMQDVLCMSCLKKMWRRS